MYKLLMCILLGFSFPKGFSELKVKFRLLYMHVTEFMFACFYFHFLDNVF